jgi:cyclase
MLPALSLFLQVRISLMNKIFLLLSLVLVSAHAQNRRMEGPIETVPLSGNLAMLVMEPAGNVLVSTGADGAAIIDDQFAPQTQRIVDAIKALSDEPVRWVFNTHWHGDHSGGNGNFGSAGAVIVAHDNVRKRLTEEQFHLVFKARSAPRTAEHLPVITFNDRMTFHLNGDEVEVVHVPRAHTDGDALFYFRNADVLHTGDAFINRGYPLIDVASGGSIEGQIVATQTMIDLIGAETIVVSGHGPLSDRAGLIAARDMLITARRKVRELIDQGLTLKQIKNAKPLKELDADWGNGAVKARLFVSIIYQSETGDWQKPQNMPLAE